jgi:hypothetical protein
MLTTRTILTAGAAAIALAAPSAAGAQNVDLRSPDAVDAGQTPRPAPRIDLRSPDARDAATRAPATAPIAVVPAAAQPSPDDDGFGWGDAGIGAAGMLGVIGIVTGVGVLTIRRRRDDVALPSH